MSGTEAGRCVGHDARGAHCILRSTHVGSCVFVSDSYLLGKLQAAVTIYLAGECDRDLLAQTLAETEGDR